MSSEVEITAEEEQKLASHLVKTILERLDKCESKIRELERDSFSAAQRASTEKKLRMYGKGK